MVFYRQLGKMPQKRHVVFRKEEEAYLKSK